MKLIHLILFFSVIVFNEIVVELIISDDHSISLIDGSAEEKAESQKTESEGEKEVDFFNTVYQYTGSDDGYLVSLQSASLSCAMNPYIEIHSPPPEV